MAFSGGIRLIFPEIKLSHKGEYIRFEIVVGDISAPGVEDHPAYEFGVGLQTLGAIKAGYKIDEPYLVPSELDVTLIDADSWIAQRIFDINPVTAFADIERQLEIKLIYGNDSGEIVLFFGYSQEDNISFNESTRELKFNAISPLDVINELRLYDDNDNPLNPLGYNQNAMVTFQQLVSDIYKKAEPIFNTANFTHTWTFLPLNSGGYNSELYETAFIAGHLFFDNTGHFSTLGDMLRILATHFFAFTGVIGTQPFFTVLYGVTPEKQELDVISHIYRYNYPRVRYVRVEDNESLYHLPVPAERGLVEKSGIKSSNVNFNAIPRYYNEQSDAGSTAYKMQLFVEPINELARRAKTSFDDVFIDAGSSLVHAEHLAESYWQWRNETLKDRKDFFIVSGIVYDLTKNFVYKGEEFRILSIKINVNNYTTEIEAIPVKATI